MFPTLLRKMRHGARNIWVRVSLVTVLSVVAVFGAKLLGRFIPDGLNEAIGAGAVNRLLDILANSMLAVTTFSLTVMVAVRQAVSNQWSPRAQRIHLTDTRTQSVLATFIGAYMYALNAIILLEMPFFSEREVVVLYLMTLAVMGMVVLTLIRWILHLQTMGSLTDTAQRIEEEARDAFCHMMAEPTLGAQPLTDDTVIPDTAVVVHAWATGFVKYVYEDALEEAAAEADVTLYLLPRIGEMVFKGEPIAMLSRPAEGVAAQLQTGVTLGRTRSPEQDPAFGAQMLAEIGSKALSPGINDPGTAVDMIARLARLVETTPAQDAPPALRHRHLFLRPLEPARILRDGLEPIARDGAGDVAVMRALLKVTAHLAQEAALADPALAREAQAIHIRAIARARQAMAFEGDIDQLTPEMRDFSADQGA